MDIPFCLMDVVNGDYFTEKGRECRKDAGKVFHLMIEERFYFDSYYYSYLYYIVLTVDS